MNPEFEDERRGCSRRSSRASPSVSRTRSVARGCSSARTPRSSTLACATSRCASSSLPRRAGRAPARGARLPLPERRHADGVDYAERYPVATFASGPTNSMRGAAFLSGERDARVVDIGGTTSDVGILQHGFPREAAVESTSAVSVRTSACRTSCRWGSAAAASSAAIPSDDRPGQRRLRADERCVGLRRSDTLTRATSSSRRAAPTSGTRRSSIISTAASWTRLWRESRQWSPERSIASRRLPRRFRSWSSEEDRCCCVMSFPAPPASSGPSTAPSPTRSARRSPRRGRGGPRRLPGRHFTREAALDRREAEATAKAVAAGATRTAWTSSTSRRFRCLPALQRRPLSREGGRRPRPGATRCAS